jgi:hypothetical protein
MMEIVDTTKTEIRISNISGNGCFATKKIFPGEFIFTLKGEIKESTPDVSNLCAGFGISGDDPLQIGDALFLICNLQAKTINHSCNPNAGLRIRSDLYAIREINIGDEITYDYSTTSGINDKWTMKCGCHSEACRGMVGNALTLPLVTLTKYSSLNVLPDFIRNQLRIAGRLMT